MSADLSQPERITRVETLLEEHGKKLDRLVELTEKNTNFRMFMGGVGAVTGAIAGGVVSILMYVLGLKQ